MMAHLRAMTGETRTTPPQFLEYGTALFSAATTEQPHSEGKDTHDR